MGTRVNYAKQIGAIAKLYTEADKYSGKTHDSFDHKFELFVRRARNSDLPHEGLTVALDLMLKDDALAFYNQHISDTDTLGEAIDKLKSRFETEERVRLINGE